MFDPKEHLISLKGKDYLQVAWRLVWFRDVHPDWAIDTQMIYSDATRAVFKAIICDENGVQKCVGHGSESQKDFGDFLEKAETKAVGRALAMLGFGTQFTGQELDEGQRIVDSPIQMTETAEDVIRKEKLTAFEEVKQKMNMSNRDMNKALADLYKNGKAKKGTFAELGVDEYYNVLDMIEAGA